MSPLFTNMSLAETVDFMCQFIDAQQILTEIPTKSLKDSLLKFTSNFQFSFDVVCSRQEDRTAVRSPFGSLLVDIFITKLERNELKPAIEPLLLADTWMIFSVSSNRTKISMEL